MGKSKKKTPICGHAVISDGAMKRWRSKCHRRYRRMVHQLILAGHEDFPPFILVSNMWNSPEDGRGWYGNLKKDSPEYYEELMRK